MFSGADAQSFCILDYPIQIDFATEFIYELQQGVEIHLLAHYFTTVFLQYGNTDI